MKKLIRDGKVAVIIYDAGFSEWEDKKNSDLIFDPEIILEIIGFDGEKIINKNNAPKVQELILRKYKIELDDYDIFQLKIEWVPQGEKFIISNDEWGEEIILLKDLQIHEA